MRTLPDFIEQSFAEAGLLKARQRLCAHLLRDSSRKQLERSAAPYRLT